MDFSHNILSPKKKIGTVIIITVLSQSRIITVLSQGGLSLVISHILECNKIIETLKDEIKR